MDDEPPLAARPGAARLLGLAGGIASGKSTVAAHLSALGVPVLDADQLARRVVEPGQPALAAIADTFGRRFLTGDGALDRKALGARVFGDPSALAALNAITHPAIRALAEAEAAALALEGVRWAVYEAALLAEGAPPPDPLPPWRPSPLHPALSVRGGRAGLRGPALVGSSLAPPLVELIVVTAPEEVRLRRILARDGLGAEQARARVASQARDEARLRLATIALRNDGDAAALRGAAQALHALLVQRHGPVIEARGASGGGPSGPG